MDIEILTAALNASWSRDTAYRLDKDLWSEDNRAAGQCTITAMILSDYLGGEIYRGQTQDGKIFHYWNVIDGVKIDITISQFKHPIHFVKIIQKKKEDLMKISNVKKRYLVLCEKVKLYLASIKS